MSSQDSPIQGVGKALGVAVLMLFFGIGLFILLVIAAVKFASKANGA